MPGRVDGSSRVAAARTAEPLSYTAALKAVFASVDKALAQARPPKTELKLEGYDLRVGKNGVKAVVVMFDEKKDARRLGRADLPVSELYVDEKKGQFYVPHWRGALGPLPLPKGVTLRTLFDAPYPAAKNDYQKVIAGLSEKVVDRLGAAVRAGRVQFDFENGSFRSPSGEKMKHVYIDDHTGRIPGGALMVGKKEFWVEMIPGVSGDCLGPFELPRGFTLKSLDRPEPRSPRRRDTGDNDYGDRGTSGYDSSRGFPDSIGRLGGWGASSGVTPLRGSVWGNGGGGGGGS